MNSCIEASIKDRLTEFSIKMNMNTPKSSRIATCLPVRPLHLPLDDEDVMIVSPPPPLFIDLTEDTPRSPSPDPSPDQPILSQMPSWPSTFADDEEERRRVFGHEEPCSSSQPPPIIETNWPIHFGYRVYKLQDVALEESRERLERWLAIFSPQSQPRSEEEHFYVHCMHYAITMRLNTLN